MTTLTNAQINSIQAKITNGDIAGAYAELSGYGDPYGILGSNVTTNTGWEAELSNAFAASGGRKNNVELSVGSTAWRELNTDLANAYLDAYRSNGNSTPSWDTVQNIHNTAYGDAGLAQDDWLPNRLLNDSSDPAATWADLLANQGAADIWGDSFGVAEAGAGMALNPWLFVAALDDPDLLAKMRFADNFYDALAHMDKNTIADMAGDFTGLPIADLLNFIHDLPHVGEGLLQKLGHVFGGALPGWLPDVTFPWTGYHNSGPPGDGSPLILDLGTTGITLAALNGPGSVYWDIDKDGFREASGWVGPEDGLLCIDVNSDGLINDHGELFGDQTGMNNGFAALAVYDTNTDGHITSADAQFGALRVWVDSNSDGISEASELHTLSSLSITEINLAMSGVNYTLAGNEVRFQSTFTMNGATRTVIDAWFNYDNKNTEYAGTYTLDARALFLPDLRGYGNIPDLHIAMSQNEDLLDMVSSLASMTRAELTDPLFDLKGAVEAIMYEWAGTAGASTNVGTSVWGDGGVFDGRRLEFMHLFMGENIASANLYGYASFMNAWNAVLSHVTGTLLMQSGLADLYGVPTYDPNTDTFSGVGSVDSFSVWFNRAGFADSINSGLSNTVYLFKEGDSPISLGGDTISSNLQSGPTDTVFLQDILETDVRMYTDGYGNLHLRYSNTDDVVLSSSRNGTGELTVFVERIAFDSGAVWDLTQGLLMVDTNDAHQLMGSAQGDAIEGRGGLDSLYGYGGNDTLNGGIGNDYMYGGLGNDTFVFVVGDSSVSSGPDYVFESSGEGTDTIRLTGGILPSDVRMFTDSYGSLRLRYSSSDEIVVSSFRNSAGELTSHVERVAFDNGVVWDLTQGLPMVDTDDAHVLLGSSFGDSIDGRGGGDSLYGYGGDDAYIFRPGDGVSGNYDSLSETAGEGTDTIVIHGVDPDDVKLWNNGYYGVYLDYTATDRILLSGSYASAGGIDLHTRIERIVFDNSTVWDLTQGLPLSDTDDGHQLIGTTLNDVVSGNGGNDIIQTFGGNDTLIGGAGEDSLSGGTGDDSYVFSPGDGPSGSSDVVYETAGEGTDTIVLHGVDPNDVRMWNDGSYYTTYLSYAATDRLAISTASAGAGGIDLSSRIERIVFDNGTVWNLTQGLPLTDTNDGHQLIGSSLNDVMYGNGGDDSLSGFNGNDILIGGAGIDTMTGGDGSDDFVFAAGDGASGYYDSVYDYTASNGTDRIVLHGIDQNNVRSWTDGSGNLWLQYTATDVVKVYGGSSSGSTVGSMVERVVFDNGTVWDLTQGLRLIDTDDSHQIMGSAQADVIEGRGGDDIIFGYAGDDVIKGGDGTDSIYSGDGNDVVDGGAGNDYLSGDSGTDTVSYASATSAVTVSLATTSAQSTGGAGTDTISGFENLVGSAYNDTLTGDGNANVIDGGAGNDAIDGAGGTDAVSYASASAGVTVNLATTTAQNTVGAGNDTITNTENLTGSAYADTLTGDSSDNVIDGGNGDDLIEGAAGNDTLTGGAGNDTLSYKNAASAVTANLATATAQNTVGAGTDTISSFENLLGSAYSDTLTGDGNANIIEGGGGNDTLNGAGGTDTLSYASATAGITMNIATTSAQSTGGAGSDTVSNFENILGSGFNDTLTGNGSNNVIEGGAGNDTLNGAGGTDTLSYERAASAITINLATTSAQTTGGAGSDTISNFENILGSAFNDTLTGNTGDNVVDGGAGNDTIQGGTGNDTMYGGLGTDTLTYAAAASAITVSLAMGSAQNTGGAGTDTISGFENLTGSASADVLTGDANANVIDGGAGNDIIDGGAGNDTLTGGSNTDTVTFASASSGVTVNLATTTAQNTIGAGTDTMSGFENLTGSAYADVLTGDAGANTINGGDGDDTIQGGAGNDTLTGGNGADTVSYAAAASAVTVNLATATAQNTGGAGSDTISGFENLFGSAFNDTLTGNSSANTIHGGAGTNSLTGGSGADIFAFDPGVAMNNIQDFSTAQGDRLDVSALIENFDPLTHAITDWVQITQSGGNSALFIDADGIGSTYGFNQVASLIGATGLTDEDALLTAGTLIV